jgi:tetratricopeptide (TPR) repeat protein
MAKKMILIVFIALVIFSAIYALWDNRQYTTSSDKAYQVYMEGETLKKKLYYNDALPEFEKAVKIDSNFAMAYCMLAELQFDFGDTTKAREYIDKAISLFPKITEKEKLYIQITKGTLFDGNKSPERYKYIDEYIKKYPDDPWTHRFHAERFIRERDYESAITEYEKIIDNDPSDALAYNMLGYLNYWAGHFDEALNNIRKYSITASKEANPHDSFGEILMYIGRYDEAIKEFEAANRIKPDLDFVLGHLGKVNREIGKYRDAIGYFERAKEFARSDNYASMEEEEIAYTLYLAGEKEQALKVISALHDQYPDWFRIVTFRGIIAAGNNKLDIAYESLAELSAMLEKADTLDASRNSKDNILVNQSILAGNIAFVEKDYEKAITNYKKSLEMAHRPGIVLVRFLLGRAYLEAGQLDLAEQTFEENLKDNPNHPFTLDSMAKLYKAKGDVDKEKQMLLMFLSVMSGADDDIKQVNEAREELDRLSEKVSL